MSGNSCRTRLKTRCHRSCANVMALDLSLMQTRLRLFLRAYSKAYRMMRSTPLRELTSSCTAISSFVSFLKKPPTPTYRPSVFSRKTMNRMSLAVIAERREMVGKELHGPRVDVQVQLEAQSQENIRGVLITGNTRIAKRPKKDGVEFATEHFHRAIRKSHPFAEKFVCSPVEIDKFNGSTRGRDRGSNHFHGFRGNFLADAVTGKHGNPRGGAAVTQRNWRQGQAS